MTRQFFLLPLLLIPFFATAQPSIDHWETAVLAQHTWRYFPGNEEPPAAWNTHSFDDAGWAEGPGGIGYADGDDNTLIPPVPSLYMRRTFEVIDTAAIELAILHADYDDAFVAYLNGVEIARANIGTPGLPPPYTAFSDTDREALMYQGGVPEDFLISKQQLSQLLVDGMNTLAFQVHNASPGSSDMSSIFFFSFGIKDESSHYNPVPAWFYTPFLSSNLPLLIIDTYGQTIPNEPKIEAHLGIVDNGPGVRNYLTDAFNGYDGRIAIEIRGSSSQAFPKKNYGFETQDSLGENNNVSLLGMPEENDWVLHGPYSDKTLMRNVLSYHIGRQTGRYAPRTRWCELVVNGQYLGLYVLVEKIKRDENRVDIATLQPEDIAGDELTGGYIFAIDRHDPGEDDGWYSQYVTDVFYRYEDPSHNDLAQVQKDYLRNYVKGFETAMVSSQMSQVYDQYVDVPSWIDYWIATEIFKHVDAYKLSFFMYKEKDSDGGKIHFGPLWDLNLAYGNFDFGTESPAPSGWSWTWANWGYLRPYWVADLSTLPEVQNLTKCRWEELRQAGLQTGNLLQFIDENAALIEEARIRNFERWPVLGVYVWPNDFVGATYEDELSFLKVWLINRLSWMDVNMPGDCSAVASEEAPLPELTLQVYPNPFQTELSFFFDHSTLKNGEVTLFDALGRNAGQVELTAGQAGKIQLEGFSPGIYFYRLTIDGKVLGRGKVVKE